MNDIKEYLEKTITISSKEYNYLITTYGKEALKDTLNNIISDIKAEELDTNNFYQNQKELWEKYGYCFSRLKYYPFFDEIANKFNECSKESSYKNKQQLITDEIKYGFQLLNKNYISFLNKKGNININKIFSELKTNNAKKKALEKFNNFYQKLKTLSSEDKKNILALKKIKIDNTNDTEEEDTRLLEELDMYFDYRIAKYHLINDNIGLVRKVANNYKKNHIFTIDDYIQEGYLGLTTAIDRFDIRHGCKISTYAYFWINRSILMYYKEKYGIVKIPSWLVYEYNKLCNISSNHFKKTGIHLTNEELSEITGLTLDMVNNIYSRMEEMTCESINREITNRKGDITLIGEFVKDINIPFDEKIINELDYQTFYKTMSEILTDKELDILVSYYGLGNRKGMIQKEIAAKYNVSRQSIQQITDRSIKKLRRSGRIQKLNPYR